MKRLLTTSFPTKREELGGWLDAQWLKYESPEFIDSDPIQIPQSFTKKEDQEISGFLAATIAWGQRKTIINNAHSIVERMDQAPHDFILSAEDQDMKRLEGFVHRTFNDTDLLFFVASLRNIYRHHGGLETVFAHAITSKGQMGLAIAEFKKVFFSIEHPCRTTKHVADPTRGSSAKRINMYLRWMVRSKEKGVDLGIWNQISPSQLYVPLDVHTGNVARELGLLTRKQNDWKAVEELMEVLRSFDAEDPVKYDFALFGTGVFDRKP